MAEANRTLGDGDGGPRKLIEVFAGRHVVGGLRAGQVTVEADPVDRRDRAILLVLVGGSELGRFLGEHQLHQRDAAAHLDQVLGASQENLVRDLDVIDVLRREHRNMVQTNVRPGKAFGSLISLFARSFH